MLVALHPCVCLRASACESLRPLHQFVVPTLYACLFVFAVRSFVCASRAVTVESVVARLLSRGPWRHRVMCVAAALVLLAFQPRFAVSHVGVFGFVADTQVGCVLSLCGAPPRPKPPTELSLVTGGSHATFLIPGLR